MDDLGNNVNKPSYMTKKAKHLYYEHACTRENERPAKAHIYMDTGEIILEAGWTAQMH